MIVVVGHLDVDPADRDRFVRLSQESVRRARDTEGCLHFAVTADPLCAGRVDVAERWRDRPALEAFRGSGPAGDLGDAVQAFHVEEVEVPEAAEEHSGRRTTDRRDTDAEIRALLEERVQAVAAKDPAPLAARFADGLDSFGVLPPHRVRGRDTLVEGTQAWFDGYASDIAYGVHDLRIISEGGLAVTAFVYRVTGTLHGGSDVDMWVRSTGVLRRGEDGRWVLTHQHESVPWDPTTGQGVLTPDG
ncbi:SgcJ/EcaC family oxidoreductase [Janibacter sp. GS2]|uniref:SgcJ/EcaC family oxidoreductase n=1 Tax=Janibacter sp. GS2 TaxID=3442646 RepID=UPI003EBD1EED